ncbi:malto-oligosyltrehalose synthase [Pseudomonas typographi]|uniref:Malto-oligosyltrehalose synthase n=1 Tax=Pseudomonas typographi TaxID=2715964 RepID=A0ABR7Z6X8_9PSED|nr:malto-oligosyltrehalose synthase [Pseudomonas typographi]MBD1554008.1 malto-oligosyltrehalose synthase [Pseudomonas typographi]MBD1601276.1 malto-oligosyltrehalose synthase [Pseudomonas typographi]
MKALSATLRLQFHKGFTLDDAVPLVPYFDRLGISHVYASPILKARPGSMHGYDVVDPTQVNPELGGEAALRRLVAALREHGMGFILDIVSNHMAVGGPHNPWWLALLEWGQRSRYAKFFDIQWHSPDPLLEGLLLVPFLGNDYGKALQDGELPLRFDADTGGFYVEHYEHRFPICPPGYADLLAATGEPTLLALAGRFADLTHAADAPARAEGLRTELAALVRDPAISSALATVLKQYDGRDPAGLQRLHQLLEKQHYRLASWRTAADDINWRRFFDINELGGLRVERSEVFEATHGKIFELVAQGLVDGLRIDHIDGLADPHGYCRKLRRRVERLLPARPAGTELGHFPIYVEKILGQGEHLHTDWGVDGTTGYEFMNQVSLLQHDPRGQAPLAQCWARTSGRPADFMEEARAAREMVLAGTLAGDFEAVAQMLLRVARNDLMSRDLTLGAIRRALQALIVHFPVYRTYINACGRPVADEPFFQQALEGARASINEGDWPVLDYLAQWLGGQPWRKLGPGSARRTLRHACTRFQQLTSPAAAKAVEDTAFYRSAVLLSRNDVGFDPQVFSAPAEAFHAACLERHRHFPGNLLTTATHDHKRGEDSRARLAVLSERGPWYSALLTHWQALATPLRSEQEGTTVPTGGDEAMLYQALLGSWPLGLTPDDDEGLAAYCERMLQWQQKALREAKLLSSWSAPNEAYEQGCRDYLSQLLTSPHALDLRQSIASAVNLIAPAGALNSLAQCLLRMTAPGVPDLYQGAEYWDFSLVDPDNRRPVDYTARSVSLGQAPNDPAALIGRWDNGQIKQALIARVLNLRRSHAQLFTQGDYQPLEVAGEHAGNVLAFARSWQGQRAIVIVPRLYSEGLGDSRQPLIESDKWGDTHIKLPLSPALPTTLKGLFSDLAVTANATVPIAEALKEFPVNLYLQSDL